MTGQRQRHDDRGEHGIGEPHHGEKIAMPDAIADHAEHRRNQRPRIIQRRQQGQQQHRRFQSQTPGGSGFLANILESLDAMTQAEFIEIEKLIQIMEERYRIGDKLFDIILNKGAKAAEVQAAPPAA